MQTKLLKLPPGGDYGQMVRDASQALGDGGLVAFPTETVYGLGASAAHPEAIRRLRQVKQRPPGKPFTAMIGRREDVTRYVGQLSPLANRLVNKGWPGPLTLIFNVPDSPPTPIQEELASEHHGSMYHQGTIGLRCPDMPLACDLLNQVPAPVLVSSANKAGRPAPAEAHEVLEGLDGLIDLVIDGGMVRYCKPSTVVRVSNGQYRILRPGVYDERAIQRLASLGLLFVCTGNTCRSPMAEAICRKLLAERLGCGLDELPQRGVHISSVGTAAASGGQASPEAVKACKDRGVDLGSHRTRPLAPAEVYAADSVFCMTESHRMSVLSLVPSAESKTCCLDRGGPIEDPAGSEAGQYQQIADRIERVLRDRLAEIQI